MFFEFSDSRLGQSWRYRQTRQVGLRNLRMTTIPKTVYSASNANMTGKSIAIVTQMLRSPQP